MELDEALAQIAEIRSRIARTETFRGYRSVTVGFTGVLAVMAAAVQAVWIPNPLEQMSAYLSLWIAMAAVSLLTTATEMTVRSRRVSLPMSRRLTWLAVEQFSPCLVAGAMLTYVLFLFSPQSLWMLPGLWSILFSLGVFASSRLVARSATWVAAYYLAAGILCLAMAREEAALSPWAMAGTFGVGQLLAAVILHHTVEKSDVSK